MSRDSGASRIPTFSLALILMASACGDSALTTTTLPTGTAAVSTTTQVSPSTTTAASEFPAAEAISLFEQATDSFDAGQFEDGLATLEELFNRFGDSTDPAVIPVVARALYNKGTAFYESGRFEEALTSYQELVDRYGDRTDYPVILFDVADGLFNQGLALHELGRHEEELAAFEDLISRFGDATNPYFPPQVARALNNKGVALYELGRYEEELAAYEDVISRFGDSTDPAILPHLAKAYLFQGFSLEAMQRSSEARAAYEELVNRFEDSTDPQIAEFVATAKVQLGQARVYNELACFVFDSVFAHISDRVAGIDLIVAGDLEAAAVALDAVSSDFESDLNTLRTLPSVPEAMEPAASIMEVSLQNFVTGTALAAQGAREADYDKIEAAEMILIEGDAPLLAILATGVADDICGWTFASG